jgi:amino acid transporter
LIITLPTVLSYASLSRYAPSAGAAAAWLWTTVNPTTGLVAGLVMIVYFVMTAISVPLLFALFFRDFVEWAHVGISGMPLLATGLVLQSALIAWICLRGAEASIKTTIRLMLIETGVVLALSATILWVNAGHAGAVNLGPFNPAHATHGLTGFWAAIILGMLAFSGFDVIATAAEEAQAPRRYVPRVLIIAVVGVGLFWAVNAWVLTLSAPLAQVLEYNSQGLTAITPVARAYWGWGNVLVVATAFTGLTAIYIASVQGASRLIFAMARHGLLPPHFAKLRGAKRVPQNAVLIVVLTCVALGLLSLAILQDGLNSFIWWSNALVFFAALTYTGVNVANIVYFRRIAPAHFNLLRNMLVPVAGICLNLYLIYAAFFSALWAAPLRTGKSVVLICLALFALLLVSAACMRLFRREVLTGPAPVSVDTTGNDSSSAYDP